MISKNKLFLVFVTLILCISLIAPAVADENGTPPPTTISVSKTATGQWESGGEGYSVSGIITVKNKGENTAYILYIKDIVQSKHGSIWVDIHEEYLLGPLLHDRALVLAPGESYALNYKIYFDPDDDIEEYQNQVFVMLENSDSGNREFYYSKGFSITINTPTCCPPPTSLEISKTATGHWEKLYEWSIEKTVDKSSLSLNSYESEDVTYTIIVDATGKNTDPCVSGFITITNDVENTAYISYIKDVIQTKNGEWSDWHTENLLGSFTLAPGETRTIPYNIEFKLDGDNREYRNVVYVMLENHPDGNHEFFYREDFTILDPVEIDESATVSDTFYGVLGAVNISGTPYTWQYSRTMECNECGGYEVNNTATLVTDDTGTTISDSTNVVVTCNCDNATIVLGIEGCDTETANICAMLNLTSGNYPSSKVIFTIYDAGNNVVDTITRDVGSMTAPPATVKTICVDYAINEPGDYCFQAEWKTDDECTIATSNRACCYFVPSLGTWGFVILIGLLLGITGYYSKRKKEDFI
ncbi:MAG: hypothetical protein ACXQTP_03715 [Candidatus Methanofastidiosia archaeon]